MRENMIFKEKSKKVKYNQYSEDKKIVDRRINLKKDVAIESNKIIAVFNNENQAMKLNSSILFNIGMECFYKQLEKLSEEEMIAYLKKGIIAQ